MAQAVFNNIYNGYIYNSTGNYFTCRDAISGTVGDIFCVGQRLVTTTYTIYRGFLYYDTSGIPSDAIIVSATIALPSVDDRSDTDFNITIRGADSASNPLIAGDYDLTHYDGDNLGELTVYPPITSNDYKNYTLNDRGIDYINRGGITKFVFLSKEDIDNSPPTDNEWIYINVVGQGYNLTITYFLPTTAPTVETINEACEDRQSTTLTAVGEITGTGDGYTYRGFEYYQYDSEYDSSMWAVREIGRFVTPCIYRMTLYGLKPSTIYWIRAYAGNIFGISYGEWVLCSTVGVQVGTYDVYTEPNTAKYRLYVSDDEAIAWRGYKGPYSGKQTLINIKDITNLTKGMKVLKIDLPEAGKKGTFHICITVKQELKG